MFEHKKVYEKTATQSGIRLGNGLIWINLISITLIMVFLFIPSSVVRNVMAVPFLMIFPGYTLLAVIFPSRERISNIERLVFSIGLSVAVAILLGLFLNYTPWEIRVEPVLYSLSAVIFLNSIIAWFRLRGLSKSQQFGFYLDLSWLKQPKSFTNSLITVALVFAILGALSYMIYISIQPSVAETYSEFYVLGQNGELDGYPEVMTSGETGSVRIGIANHEGRKITYSIAVNSNSESSDTIKKKIELKDGQIWEGPITFLVSQPGTQEKIEFLLYRGGDKSPYRKLHLMINVTY